MKYFIFSGMQCSYGIISMGHSLEGTLDLNGTVLDFSYEKPIKIRQILLKLVFQ